MFISHHKRFKMKNQKVAHFCGRKKFRVVSVPQRSLELTYNEYKKLDGDKKLLRNFTMVIFPELQHCKADLDFCLQKVVEDDGLD